MQDCYDPISHTCALNGIYCDTCPLGEYYRGGRQIKPYKRLVLKHLAENSLYDYNIIQIVKGMNNYVNDSC